MMGKDAERSKTARINLTLCYYDNKKDVVFCYKNPRKLGKILDKKTWRDYNEDETRKLGNFLWRFLLWIKTKY